MKGVEFVAVNTDAQDLKMSKADAKIQIGMNLTKGLGAGAKNDIGQAAADESLNEIVSYIQGSNMVFIAAGMGGGTGTGASHVVARAARELNILTVGVTTLPFTYEGPKRMRRALAGLEELKKHLDTVIEVPNQNAATVAMKTVLSSDKFQNAEMELPIALGKTISNETFVVDLAKMPHLLMAGATGQGKSVGLNAVLTSLIYKKHPAEVKFVLVDPKKVELNIYSKIERHYLAKLPDTEESIITDNTKVINTLNSLCIEMDNRYELLLSLIHI